MCLKNHDCMLNFYKKKLDKFIFHKLLLTSKGSHCESTLNFICNESFHSVNKRFLN